MKIIRRGSLHIFLSILLITAACAGDANKTMGVTPPAGDVLMSRVVDVSTSGEEGLVDVRVKADGPIQYAAFKMTDPPRLIVDMSSVDLSSYQNTIVVAKSPVNEIKPIYFPESGDSRLEIELTRDAAYYVNDKTPSELIITFNESAISFVPESNKNDVTVEAETQMDDAGGEGAVASADEYSEVAQAVDEKPVGEIEENLQPDPMDTMTVTDLASGIDKVQDVKFNLVDGLSQVVVTMSHNNPEYELLAREELERLTINLPGAIVAPEDERLINVNLDEALVKNIAVFQFAVGDEPIAKVVVNLDKMELYDLTTDGNKLILNIGDDVVLALASEVGEEEELINITEPVIFEEKFEGKLISLDFQKADIHNILRIISDVSGKNIITSDKVKGEVTIKMKDVPWDQALDVVLRNNGLAKTEEGDIIRVATAEEIQKESEAREKLAETNKKIEPLFLKVFELSYESVADLKANLDSVKSERGTVDINERTNALIVKDTKDKLAEMEKLIKRLDKREEQVLIESRIVEVSKNYERKLGIQWGGFYSGVTSQNFPSTIGVTGGAGGSPNVPAGGGGSIVNAPITGAIGGFGITLGHINGTALLDARLQAMEKDGKGRIVSMPKITTMNNKEAIIESGEEVPYETVSSEGTKIEFKKAVLSMKVKPHITPDRFVRLEIETKKDQADFTNLVKGVPPLKTKMAKTEVLVADGDTTVLGGLFTNQDEGTDNKVPMFGDVPILGWLFKSQEKKVTGEELLIFITPKITE